MHPWPQLTCSYRPHRWPHPVQPTLFSRPSRGVHDICSPPLFDGADRRLGQNIRLTRMLRQRGLDVGFFISWNCVRTTALWQNFGAHTFQSHCCTGAGDRCLETRAANNSNTTTTFLCCNWRHFNRNAADNAIGIFLWHPSPTLKKPSRPPAVPLTHTVHSPSSDHVLGCHLRQWANHICSGTQPGVPLRCDHPSRYRVGQIRLRSSYRYDTAETALLSCGQLDFESVVTAQKDEFKGSFDSSYLRFLKVKT